MAKGPRPVTEDEDEDPLGEEAATKLDDTSPTRPTTSNNQYNHLRPQRKERRTEEEWEEILGKRFSERIRNPPKKPTATSKPLGPVTLKINKQDRPWEPGKRRIPARKIRSIHPSR